MNPITVPRGPWQKAFESLWGKLVPRSGHAATVQGEVIRIVGKVTREILDNGSVNWGPGYRTLVDGLGQHLTSGTALPEPVGTELRGLVHRLHTGTVEREELYRLAELAVEWVSLNPTPIPLGEVSYTL